MKNTSYVTILGWMLELDFANVKELNAFALIYGFSKDGHSEFTGSINYLCEFLMCTRKTAIGVLSSLVEKELIIKRQQTINNVTFNRYSVSTQVVEKLHGGSSEITPGGSVKITPGGSEKITPNIDTINNTNTNNTNSISKEIVNSIYAAYPSKCPTQNRSTGKSRVRDLAGIRRSLKKHEMTPEQMLDAVTQYVADCKKNKTYMMNFSTFLNGVPDESTEEVPFQHEAKLILESGNLFATNIKGVYTKIVGDSHSSLINEYKRTLESGERGSEEEFNQWCVQKIKERYKL